MKRLYIVAILLFVMCFCGIAQEAVQDTTIVAHTFISETDGLHQEIKIKFIEGSALFMSVIALTLILGLAFCLERIIYLNLSQVNTKKLLKDVDGLLGKDEIEAAKDVARNTRGPVASITYQALSKLDEDLDVIEKSIVSYGSVQAGLLEKNFSWITLFIAMAPSLGFLGTVIGMIQAFDKIQQYGDISPTIVAGGMKVALITTVGGLVVAMILQVFYNYILSKEESILNEMEDSSVSLMDSVIRYKSRHKVSLK